MVVLAALLVYDYFLTLKDEVAEFHDHSDTERNLTPSSRSVMHGGRRMVSVRKPSRYLCSALTNDHLSVRLISTREHHPHPHPPHTRIILA